MNINNILIYLTELKANNNREWFIANKKSYEAARKTALLFVEKIIESLAISDDQIKSVKAKECFFRINRDIRFSKDKSPYKTNFGAFISKGGRKGPYSGYYIHFEPGSCFLAGGIHMPPPEITKAVRNEIYFCYNDFNQIVSDKNFIKYFSDLSGESLVKTPKEYPPDHPGSEYLKLKSYTVMHYVDDINVLKSNYFDYALRILKEIKPLNYFLNRAVDNLQG